MNKFTSRKLLAAVAGILTGIALIISGNTVEGASAVITSIVAYIVAEGYIDSKAVKNTIEATQKVLDETMENLDNIEEGEQNDRT
jgi:hypothetical protein